MNPVYIGFTVLSNENVEGEILCLKTQKVILQLSNINKMSIYVTFARKISGSNLFFSVTQVRLDYFVF